MSALAPTLEAFFTDRLIREHHASPQTVAAYRDAWRLLLRFAAHRTGKPPCGLDLDDLDAPTISAFLDHLEHERHNSVRTRNARLAAIHSLFRYAALQHPEHAAVISRVLAMPPKRHDTRIVTYLTEDEADALIAAPDTTTWCGRRDQTMLVLAAQTGLRVSELIGLNRADVHLGVGPHVVCHGKGRKERVTPLAAPTITALSRWLQERRGLPDEPLFPTATGRRLSRDAVEHRLAVHVRTAADRCPSLGAKNITAHMLRHTAAMRLLEAGVDTIVIALWLGHEQVDTTAIYLHAHLGIKEQALARTRPPTVKPGRYRPPDRLLAFLEGL